MMPSARDLVYCAVLMDVAPWLRRYRIAYGPEPIDVVAGWCERFGFHPIDVVDEPAPTVGWHDGIPLASCRALWGFGGRPLIAAVSLDTGEVVDDGEVQHA